MASLGLGSSRKRLTDPVPVIPLLKNTYIPVESFVYEPLTPGQIRLVHVVTCSDIRVECELRHFDFDLLRSWSALSHVWGDGPADHEIMLNGRSFSIRSNLLGALKAFDSCRHCIQENMWIWIDALCLNQDDNTEKSEQVPYMHRIYSRATLVTIWLGDDRVCPRMIVEAFRHLWFTDSLARVTDDGKVRQLARDLISSTAVLERCYGITHQQLAAFQKLYDHMAAACDHQFTHLELAIANPAWKKFAFKEDLPPPDHFFWGALLAFTNNPWHTRVWTLQEVWLAKSKALLSAQGLIPWDFIYKYLRILVFPGCRFRYISPTHMSEMQHWMHTDDAFLSIAQQRLYTSMDFPGSLAWLLTESHNRKATLTKDHIYGLFGMMKEEVKSNITIDYGATDAKIFSEAFKLAIGPKFGDAEELSHLWWRTSNSKPPEIGDWPTWCPRFGGVDVPAYSCPTPYPGEVDDDTVESWRRFARVDIGQGQDVLGFSAWYLDSVQRCAPKSVGTSFERINREGDSLKTDDDNHQVVFDVCFDMEQREWLRGLRAVFPDPDGFIDSRLVQFVHGSCVHENYHLDFDTMERALMAFLAIDIEGLRTIKDFERLLSVTRNGVFSLLYHLLAIATVQKGKFIFETESGKLGFAWRSLSTGDKVVYVPGGHCQFLVSADGRTFLGACYVQGYAGDALISILSHEKKDWSMFYVE